jgi:hypothetical protein
MWTRPLRRKTTVEPVVAVLTGRDGQGRYLASFSESGRIAEDGNRTSNGTAEGAVPTTPFAYTGPPTLGVNQKSNELLLLIDHKIM